MPLRESVEVRIITTKQLGDEFLGSMNEWMNRDGWRLIKQPSYRQSRKEPDDIIIYTEWIKKED
ncbi:MAG: hypothetical protein F6K08_20885 [Okeania sp. SIO1H6]|uniref:hypothetical protein n=1 Tax=Okeania sp. SIO1F9 TaxID=2607813 RepID=UPI0013C88DDD|nr:hypothetical protein [Okeania sp. SIO1F9]NET15104.1 hypothetical protein [Okeania sp. SIO1H6]NET79724.1 hypothetical protein [Okeania sp. SIO1F9]NET79736.1 hypothetical protein [Okeania sp. SIO1F9]